MNDSIFKGMMEHAHTDEKEAIVYLAKIIPEEAKKQIKRNIYDDPDFAVRQHMFLGMRVRNALRVAGFSYGSQVMDRMWFRWLEKAVNLPEDKIMLTDSLKRRMERYRESELLDNPPVCPKLKMDQINSIKEQLEKRYRIKMPFINILYSEDIESSFTLMPSTYNLDELEYVKKDRDHKLLARGVKREEISQIDASTYTVFLLTKQPKQEIGLYASAWHELAHVAAHVISIEDIVDNESFAVLNQFRALLKAAKNGFFTKDKAIDAVEFYIKRAKLEQLDAALFSRLNEMGLKVPADLKNAYHHRALDIIKKHNPELKFHGRNLDELIAELDRSIQYILNFWRKKKMLAIARIVIPAIVIPASLIIFLLWASSL